jgi:hypothetical protein
MLPSPKVKEINKQRKIMPMAHDQNCHLDTITQKKYLG